MFKKETALRLRFQALIKQNEALILSSYNSNEALFFHKNKPRKSTRKCEKKKTRFHTYFGLGFQCSIFFSERRKLEVVWSENSCSEERVQVRRHQWRKRRYSVLGEVVGEKMVDWRKRRGKIKSSEGVFGLKKKKELISSLFDFWYLFDFFYLLVLH